MAASRVDISGWFDQAMSKGATHLIVVCDTFDWDDYPVFVDNPEDFWTKFELYNKPTNASKIMEVYDLSIPKDVQMGEGRAWHVPPRTNS